MKGGGGRGEEWALRHLSVNKVEKSATCADNCLIFPNEN